MYRRIGNAFTYRVSSHLSRWWTNVRYRWYTTNKTPFVVAFVLISVLGSLAAGFSLAIDSMFVRKDEQTDLACLALNVYHEARGETLAGQYAVAEVTMNRLASRRFPKTVCGVVYEKNWDPLRKRYIGAFSWTEFEHLAPPKGEQWERAWRVADAVYSGRHAPELNGALYYHAANIDPSWSGEKKRIAEIGNHIFYR
jgi:spore germination cell wall hydrolase CwlJ-like protein